MRTHTVRRNLAAAAIVVAGLTTMPAHAAGASTLSLQNCHLTVDFLLAKNGQRMYSEGWLPKSRQLAPVPGFPPGRPGGASLTIWIFDCDSTSVDARSTGRATISLTGIQIQDRVYGGASPTHWDNYMVFAHTNNESIATALRAAHLPADLVPGMRFTWRDKNGTTTSSVPWAPSPYSMTMHGRIHDEPHLHDNTFQHGDAAGGPQLELVIDPLVPRDKFCIPSAQVDCMRIKTQPGTSMARFLGAATYTLAADHDNLTKVVMKLSR
jgi:hypothetical protein